MSLSPQVSQAQIYIFLLYRTQRICSAFAKQGLPSVNVQVLFVRSIIIPNTVVTPSHAVPCCLGSTGRQMAPGPFSVSCKTKRRSLFLASVLRPSTKFRNLLLRS